MTDPTGVVVYDQTIPETTGLVEAPLVFNPPSVLDPASLLGSLTGAVVLLEPTTESPAAGETPVYMNTPTGSLRQVSDLILGFKTVGSSTPSVLLISDGDPSLSPWVSALTGVPGLTFSEETGSLQDFKKALGLSSTGYKIEAMSDVSVVPEPETFGVLAAGLLLLTALRARKS